MGTPIAIPSGVTIGALANVLGVDDFDDFEVANLLGVVDLGGCMYFCFPGCAWLSAESENKRERYML